MGEASLGLRDGPRGGRFGRLGGAATRGLVCRVPGGAGAGGLRRHGRSAGRCGLRRDGVGGEGEAPLKRVGDGDVGRVGGGPDGGEARRLEGGGGPQAAARQVDDRRGRRDCRRGPAEGRYRRLRRGLCGGGRLCERARGRRRRQCLWQPRRRRLRPGRLTKIASRRRRRRETRRGGGRGGAFLVHIHERQRLDEVALRRLRQRRWEVGVTAGRRHRHGPPAAHLHVVGIGGLQFSGRASSVQPLLEDFVLCKGHRVCAWAWAWA